MTGRAPSDAGGGSEVVAARGRVAGASHAHDSAGQPWAGRAFQPNAHAGDDGRADPALAAAIAAHDLPGLVAALRTARLLVPLLAEAGTVGRTASGRLVEKTQELSLVKVAGPDGRPTLPVFSSVDTMRVWDAAARPIPAEARLVALAAGRDGDGVVLDPGSPHVLLLDWSMLAAIATGDPWEPAPRG